MALAGNGVLAIWNGIAEAAEADFVNWHIHEHIPERVVVPGFLRGRRYVAIQGTPKYFNFYETETVDVLTSAAYRARLDAPSEWTKRVVRQFRQTSRTICSVFASLGCGDGAFIATIRLSGAEQVERTAAQAGAAVLRPLIDAPGIVAAHLLRGHSQVDQAATAEKTLRGVPDESAAWILLIEAIEHAALEEAVDAHTTPRALAALSLSYSERDLGYYRLQYALSRHQIA